jgi:Right handed beta helix region
MICRVGRPLFVRVLLGTAWILAVHQSGAAGAGLEDDATRNAAWAATPARAANQAEARPCRPLPAAAVVGGARLSAGTCYEVQSPLVVSGGALVVEPGVRLGFGPRAHLVISNGGSLNALGTAERPIVFTSMKAAGTWRGVHFNGSRSPENVLRYVTIENGGSAGWTGAAHSTSALLLSGNSLVDVQHCTIAGSRGQGLTAYAGAEMTFEDNTLRGNAVAAWVHPDAAGSVGRTTTFVGNTANVVRVGFGNTDTVSAADTWQALAVPYEIQDRFFIGAPLTLAPGAVLTFKTDTSAILRTGGSITAVGTADAPITFTSVENLPGYWKGLQITTASASNRFDHVIFENGGSQPWTGSDDARAMVYLEGNSKAVFTHTTFRGSGHYGLWVPAGGNIAGFDGNIFTGNARAMIVHANRAGAISANNTFRDNTENTVRVSFGNNDALVTAQTWNDFNTPFYVTTRTFIQAPLTIADGTEVAFAQDASLIVNQQGALRAAGIDGNPVVFRGGEDLEGYWQGIEYGTASAGNALTYVIVSNAGSRPWFGGDNSTASIDVTSTGRVALEHVRFEKSGGHAVIVQGRGRIACSAVDHGGFQFYDSAARRALPGCPR